MPKPRHILGEWHSDNKKIEACTAYLVLGKAPLVEQITGVPSGTIRRWKSEPWWEDLVAQIQAEDDQELDGKLAKRINKALDIVDDRLSSGDFMFDPKSGRFKRRPVALKDTWKVTKEMVDLRQHLRKNTTKHVAAEAASDILKNLASEFAQMARKRLTEKVIDGEEFSERVRPISGEANSDQTSGSSQCSPPVNDESGTGPEGGWERRGSQDSISQGGFPEQVQPADQTQVGESVV